MTSLTYPSGRVVEQQYDSAGRLSQILTGATTYASGYNYDPSGAVTAFNYGNNVHASFGYNSRLQLETLGYTNGGTPLFGLTYDYHLGVDNNGQIRKITDTVDAGRTVNYTYDELGRLKTAITNGSATYAQWGLKWTYDRYGNRTNQEVTAGNSGYGVPLTFNTSTNRISDRTYDASGNLWQDGTYAYKYDAENRAVDYGAGGATYGFDGNGLRVKRGYGAITIYIFSGAKVIAEYASGAAANAPTREYIYAGGLLASIESATTKYYYPDHLSTRMTMAGGTTTQQGHYPFGENWYPTSTTEKWKFTSYERGDENGNDYAVFRSYISRYGRFQTPDPAGMSAVDPTNPQSWNRYAYVANNAINAKDPSGLKIALVSMACTWDPVCSGGGGYVDGVLTNMGMVSALLNSGSGVQCPGNMCEFAQSSADGGAVWVQFRAFDGMGSGFYAASGPGSWHFNSDSAGKGAVSWYESTTANDPQHRERKGKIFQDSNGIFSFTGAVLGSPCGLKEMCVNLTPFLPLPAGTQEAGEYHTHPYVRGENQFGGDQLYYGTNQPTIVLPGNGIMPSITIPGRSVYGLPAYVGTPGGGVFRIDGGKGPINNICHLAGPNIGDIGSCE